MKNFVIYKCFALDIFVYFCFKRGVRFKNSRNDVTLMKHFGLDTYRRIASHLIKVIVEDLKYPTDDIRYYLRPPTSGNRFPVLDSSLPKDFPLGQLEAVVRRAFAARGMHVLDEFFKEGKPEYPENLAIFGFATIENYSKRLIASIIATNLDVNGRKVEYISKYAVDPAFQGNHVGKTLFDAIRKNAEEERIPVILRTSDPALDKMYGKASDISVKVDDFYMHGFGFMKTRKSIKTWYRKTIIGEKFNGAENLFYEAAKQVAKIVKTAVPMKSPQIEPAFVY